MVEHEAKIQLSNMKTGLATPQPCLVGGVGTYSEALSYLLGTLGCLWWSLRSEGVGS